MYIILLLCFTVRFVALKLCKTKIYSCFLHIKNLIVPIGKLLNAYKPRCDFLIFIFCLLVHSFKLGSGTVLSRHRVRQVGGRALMEGFFPLIVSALPLLSASFCLEKKAKSIRCRGPLSSSLSTHPSLQQPFLTVSLQLWPEAEAENDLL